MGVITTTNIPRGKKFGPIPTTLTLADPGFLIGHMTCDNRPDVHTVRVDISDFADGARAAEWVPYMQPARDDREQNFEAFLHEGQLYYRAMKDIASGDELLVWYSGSYEEVLGIPEIQPFYIKEGGIFTCPYCMDTFKYPYSLRAHMRFKCEHRRMLHRVQVKQTNVSGPYTIRDETEVTGSPSESSLKLGKYNHANFFASYPRFLETKCPGSDGSLGLLSSPSSTVSSNSGGQSSPGATQIRDCRTSDSPRASPDKRPAESCRNTPSPKRRAIVDDLGKDAHGSGNGNVERSSPVCSRAAETKSSRLDQNQNFDEIDVVNHNSDEEGASAFRKVEKQHPSLSPPMPSVSSFSMTSQESCPTTLFAPTPISVSKATVRLTDKDIRVCTAASTLLGHPRPLFVGSGVSTTAPTAGYNENLPINLPNMYKAHLKTNDFGRMAEKLADIRNIENNDLQLNRKMPFFNEARINLNVNMSYPLYKPANPMVEKILQTSTFSVPPSYTLFGLGQNWCAKCNATFRMTSDLVYHMRSHHKREFDPLKRKREEKLKCNVCGECFRERHHLTRHMTSHV